MSQLAKDDVTRKMTNFGAVKGARDPWPAEQFEMVQ